MLVLVLAGAHENGHMEEVAVVRLLPSPHRISDILCTSLQSFQAAAQLEFVAGQGEINFL